MIKIYDLVADKCREQQSLNKDIGIRSLSISLNAYCMVAADSAGICHVYKLKDGEELEFFQKLDAHNDYILKCQISPDVSLMATCSADKTVKIWTLTPKGYELNRVLYGHNKWVWDCAFSWGKVEYLATASTDSLAKIWQVETGDCLRELKDHTKGINCLAMNDLPT